MEQPKSTEGDDFVVYVRRHPLDWQTAEYRLSALSCELFWDRQSGGVNKGTSHPALFGYVMCDEMLSGELAHSCAHGPAPHRIKVCLVKKLNKARWKELLQRVSPPRRPVLLFRVPRSILEMHEAKRNGGTRTIG